MLKKIIVFFIALFLVVQFFQPGKTNPEVKADLQADLSVKQILKNSCYDCHSNETMPLSSYLILHPNSELTKENLDTIKAWADSN